MKLTTTLLTLLAAATATSATPIITNRQTFGGSSTSTDLEDGKCGAVVFIFARGSGEIGNMGSLVGPPTCSALRQKYGADQVVCQGVGGAYGADIGSNALPGGTSTAALQEAARLFALAHTQCPDAAIVAGGYSQGAAVMTSVGKLDAAVQAQVKGVVLYGYTQNLQNRGQIPGYPAGKTKVFCNVSDAVCYGALYITAGHLTYAADVGEAAQFLEQAIGSV